MKVERLVELMAYAKVCFDHNTSPFETMHLVKKNVTSDECKELSGDVAEAIEAFLVGLSMSLNASLNAIEGQAEKEFMETQQE